jgi:hypothetical protein
MSSFLVVAKPGTVFNLTDCGLPLDITSHSAIDLSLTAKPEEIENSHQLREALHRGTLLQPTAKTELPPAPEPNFVIPDLKPTNAHLTAHVEVHEHKRVNAPSDYVVENESIPEHVRESIATGIAQNKQTEILEAQAAIARANEEEAAIETSIHTLKKPVPELLQGTVDGQPIPAGYDFKAPISPALADAQQGMGDQLPEVVADATPDPLGANEPKAKKSGKGKKNTRKGQK